MSYFVRRTLLARYLLIERRDDPSAQRGPELPPQADLTDTMEKLDEDLEVQLARLTDQTAWASLWLEVQRGGQARMTWLRAPRVHDHSAPRRGDLTRTTGHGREDLREADTLATIEAWGAKLQDLAVQDREAPRRVTDAIWRAVHLWGLAVEQELEHLHIGSDVWCEQCQLAAGLYHYCGSLRTRRICALAEAAGLDKNVEAGEAANRKFEAILEIG